MLNTARVHSEALVDGLFKKLQKSNKDPKRLIKPRTYRKEARQKFINVIRKRLRPGSTGKKRSRQEIRKGIGQQLRYVRRNIKHIGKLLGPCGTHWPLSFAALRQYQVIQEVYRQ